MAANYVLLEKITIGAAGGSVISFNNIPQTGYTDLVVKASIRANNNGLYESLVLSFNNNTTAAYTNRSLGTDASGAYSTNVGTNAYISYNGFLCHNGNTATADTFSSTDIYIPDYTTANYKSVSIDSVTETNAAGTGSVALGMGAGLWSNTAAITSIQMQTYGASSFIQNTTFYLYGVAKLNATPAISPKATGGDTIMTDGTYWIHTFLSSGTFTPVVGLSCDYLVIAGGGGGGIAGGGAGGYRTSAGTSGGGSSAESKLSLAGGTGYTVTIGGGGGGYAQGSNSVFSTITSDGGGLGRVNGVVGTTAANGVSGGSGGGALANYNSNAGTGGTATTNQGYNGGGTTASPGDTVGAGGGGAGAVGAVGTSTSGGSRGGDGGSGLASSITGTSVTRAGGGGGYGGIIKGIGGAGGGGAAEVSPAGGVSGTANTGSGGGGGWAIGFGNGGSGVVIVRYAI